MRVFLNDASDSTSLPNNYVDWVKDISGDRLIIRNASGYTIFDKRTEKFSDASSLFGSVGVDIRIEKTNIPDKKIRYMKVYVSDGPAAALELLQNVVDFDYSYDQKTNTYLVR